MGTDVCYRRNEHEGCRAGTVLQAGIDQGGNAHFEYGGLPGSTQGFKHEVTRAYGASGEPDTWHKPEACPFDRDPKLCPFADRGATTGAPAPPPPAARAVTGKAETATAGRATRSTPDDVQAP